MTNTVQINHMWPVSLKMMDFSIMKIAIKVSWIQRIEQNYILMQFGKLYQNVCLETSGPYTFLSHYRYDKKFNSVAQPTSFLLLCADDNTQI